jgi:conjugal transfer pilus assembly protein TrbC
MRKLPHLHVVASLSALPRWRAHLRRQPSQTSISQPSGRGRSARASNARLSRQRSRKGRSAGAGGEAELHEAEVHARRYAREAAASAKPNPAITFDFDRMVADAGTMTSEGMGEAPRFIAFASLSMPPAALRAMIDDVTKAGGIVALRGLPGNSAKALTAALAKVAKPGEQLDGVGIDPRLPCLRGRGRAHLRRHQQRLDLCDGFDCRTQVPPHDRMSGNVSASYALETFARRRPRRFARGPAPRPS